MAKIIFYEKPGCINGEKQKQILKDAGNELECINILQHPWNTQELLPFLTDSSPVNCMNHTAPDIKSGSIAPEKLSFDEAVEMMIKDPILIKRPLILVDGIHIQGFTDERLRPYLGSWDGRDDVVTCPNLKTISCDERVKG